MKSIILGFFLCLILSANTFATTRDFALAKLETYPKLGSAEGILDVAQLLYLQKTRTKAECASAQKEANGSGLKLFFGGKHGLLSPIELQKVEKELKWLTTKTRVKILYYKTKFNRPRPYTSHSQIKPCIELENSKSYPSGHTTLARLYGRILSVIYPERSLLFMKRADEASQNRMIGGVHYPSDVAAGKKLGDLLAEDYLEDGDRFYRLKSLVSDVSN
jgi:acid phosphatase (class A)